MKLEFPEIRSVTGASPGPTIAVLGGVHGDEYEGVIAARCLEHDLAGELRCGTVRFAAPAHPAAWMACTRESPIDGANLARVFPGRRDGSPTEQVAHVLTEQLIRGADLVIDLHSAGSHFEMPFLCGYCGGDAPHQVASQRLAETFGATFTWRHDGAPAPGRSLSVAHDLGIPSIYVEGHGGLAVRSTDLAGYLDGVRRVLAELGMLTDAPVATHRPVAVRGDGNTDAGITAPVGGYLVTACRTGQHVAAGTLIAEVVDLARSPQGSVVAPHEGYVMLLRRDARVAAGDTVCIIAEPGPVG